MSKKRHLSHLWLVSVLISDVRDRDGFSLRRVERVGALDNYRHNRGVASEVTGCALGIGGNTVVGFKSVKDIIFIIITYFQIFLGIIYRIFVKFY